MANNYTMFSVELSKLTEVETAWFKKELSYDSARDMSFQHEFEPDGAEHCLILYSEENADLDELCDLLQRYLKTFHPDKSIGVEWAFTCSKMRPGEFGGGAAFITANKQVFLNTGHWLFKTRTAWEKKNASKASKKKRRARKS